jgi:nucleoid-associated protein YgaU/DNA-binding SARP family transcriptional activator
MTRRLTRLATGLVGTVLTLALLGGPPWLLTTFVGSPVPSSWPDLDTFRTIATVGVTDTFVITTLAVIVWIAWAQLALAIVIETLAALRRRQSGRLPLFPGTQPLAARLVAATLLLVTAMQPRPLAAAAPLDLAVATTAPAVVEDEPRPLQRSTSARTATHTATQTIVAGQRDSWWSLAETHLGDGLRWREIRNLNTDRTLADGFTIRTDTEQLQPGWPLLVPASNGSDGDPPAAASAPVDDTDPADGAAALAWEVEQGDHFWHIAKTTLEQAWDRSPTDAEIAPYWRDLVDMNRDRLAPPGDPDLIHPGQQFQLPHPPADPTKELPADEMLEEAPVQDAEPDDADVDPPRTGEPEPEAAGEATVDRPADEVPDSWHRSLTAPSATGETPSVDTEHATERADVDDHPRTGWGIPAGLAPGLAASMFLAAGAAALLHRRRRIALQQRTSGYRLPTLAPEARETAEQLTVAAPSDEVLEDLVALLCSVPPAIEPVLVVAHDDGSVSLVFDHAPNGDPPVPWATDPGADGEPVRWTAKLGDRGERRSFGMPLLITLGRLGTSTLLANLGAMRQLTVHGPGEQTRTRLRAFALEVAASRTAGPVDVTVLGDDLLVDLDQVRQIDDPAEEIAAALREVEDRIIIDDRVPRLIIAHDGAPPVEIPADLVPLCGAITATPSATSWRLQLGDEHGWLHLPDGTREQVTLPDLDPALIVRALEAQSQPDAGLDDRHEPGRPDTRASQPSHDLQHPAIERAWCEVGLLGPFTVTQGENVVEGLTTISRQMLAYLVTHRETSTGKLEDAVWQGQAAQGGGQRVRSALGRLRRQLGEGPDGSPLIPSRKAGDDAIALDDRLGSDLDRAFQRLDAARHQDGLRQAEMLLEALRLVRGEPFEDLPVSWAMDIQQRAIVQLQKAAATAAQLLRDADRHDDAEYAIRQGLVLCDPCEPLYIEWARLERSQGRIDQIPRLWRRLKQRYAEDADDIAGIAAAPTSDTELEFMRLM